MTPPLTERQKEILLWIYEFFGERLRMPTYREIMKRFALESPNGVRFHFRALVSKGYLSLDPSSGIHRVAPDMIRSEIQAVVRKALARLRKERAVTMPEAVRIASTKHGRYARAR